MVKTKANRNFRSNLYFERVRNFWGKVTFLFRMKYLKSKEKKNQEIVKTSNTIVKNDILHLNAENELNKFSIPRMIKENDLILDFFQFSICCQNLIFNNPSIFYKSDLLDVVNSNFSGRYNYRRLFCFAVLINRRLNHSKLLQKLFMVNNTISGKRVLRFRKIYITCMKDVDKYLKLLSRNNVSFNSSFGYKILSPLKDRVFKERWNLNYFFRRVNMLVYLASPNRSNKRVVKTTDPVKKSLKESEFHKLAILPVWGEFNATKIPPREKKLFFNSAFTNTFGGIHNRLRFESNGNVCNQSPEHPQIEFQEYASEQLILSDRELSIDQKKSCLRLPSEFGEKSRVTENVFKYTSSFRNSDFLHSENSRGRGIRGKLNHDTCHKDVKIKKDSEDMNDINYKWNDYLMRPSYYMMPQASTQPEYINVTDMTIKYSNSHIIKDLNSADNNRNNSIGKKIVDGICNTTDTCIKPKNKFTTPETKDVLAKTEKKRKFRTSLKSDDVERAFTLIEPRYRLLQNPSCSINYQFNLADQPERMRMDDNQRQSMVNQEAGINGQKTTAGYQKLNMEVNSTIMKEQEMMNIDGKQRNTNYQHRIVVNGYSSDIKSRDQGIMMDGRKKDVNYQQTFLNHQVISEDHKKTDIDSEENVDSQEIIMDSYLTIMTAKNISAQEIKVDCRKMTKDKKVVKEGEEINMMNPISNDVQVINNINDYGETWGNNQEENRETSENLKLLKSDQGMIMGDQEIGMVDHESCRKYRSTIINYRQMIKNGGGSIMDYKRKKENREKTILENLVKSENNQRTVADRQDSNLDDHEKNIAARKIIMTAEETIEKYDEVAKLGHWKLNLNDYDRTADYLESNTDSQEKIENGQPVIPTHQEMSQADQKTSNLIYKKKRKRKLYTKKIDVKPQRIAKLKAVLLLKRPRRDRRKPPTST